MRIMLLLLCGLWTLGAASPVLAKTYEAPAANLDVLEARLVEILNEHNVPGMSFSVIAPTGARATGLGLAARQGNQPATAQTCFRQGSISKSFVALAALKLAEEGRLDLNAPVHTLLPDSGIENRWRDEHPVRVIHLLDHTAGFDDIHVNEYANGTPDISLSDGLAFNTNSRKVRWRPGHHFSYSNAGPSLAALVVEQAAGIEFESYVKQTFFDPLGMETAGYRLDEAMAERIATGHEGDGNTAADYEHILMRPAGALNASANDMLHFLQFMLNRGSFREMEILSEASMRTMETPQSTLSAREGVRAGYGLGNFTTAFKGHLFHGHSGGITGFVAHYGYLPEHQAAFAFSLNAPSGAAFQAIHDEVCRFLTRDAESRYPPEHLLASDLGSEIAGVYSQFTVRQEIGRFLMPLLGYVRVVSRDGRLYARPLLGGEEAAIYAVTDSLFRGAEDPIASMSLHRDEGTPLIQAASGPLAGTFRKSSMGRVVFFWVAAILSLALLVSSIAFALGWVPLLAVGRMRQAKHLSVRLWPLLAALSFVVWALAVFTALGNAVDKLGHLTAHSGLMFVSSLTLALAAVLGAVQVIRSRTWDISRKVWVHSALVSAAALVVAGYMTYYGLIGLRTWVY
ncbi:hypothetical protein ABI59_11330 [Acidobacteria bacterium Mor1]|nr:hypothetical protein ABI59_11330 [Acidobacteria bacterium Mor1]